MTVQCSCIFVLSDGKRTSCDYSGLWNWSGWWFREGSENFKL